MRKQASKQARKRLYTLTILVAATVGLFSPQSRGFVMPTVPETLAAKPYAAAVLFAQDAPAGAERFSDVESAAWYYPYVDYLVSKNIVNGMTETEFAPDGTLKVAECAALIVRYLGLEETAGQEQKQLQNAKNAAGSLWYGGYLKVCVDAGILTEEECGAGYKKGAFRVAEPTVAESPALRSAFAAFITRSFSLDKSDIRARNTYAERGGFGHEFIRGGLYDENALPLYAAQIKDFDDIPEAYREDVLKAYYNGIFNGDAEGCFHPNDALTRAEMAKVVSVVRDVSLRFGSDLRKAAYETKETDFRCDPDGSRVLYKTVGASILQAAASALTPEAGGSLWVPLCACAPLGYTVEAHVYGHSGAQYKELAAVGPGTENVLKDGDGVRCSTTGYSDILVTYILRSAVRGDAEGILNVCLKDGNRTTTDNIYVP